MKDVSRILIKKETRWRKCLGQRQRVGLGAGSWDLAKQKFAVNRISGGDAPRASFLSNFSICLRSSQVPGLALRSLGHWGQGAG